ncbi:MAG: YifB family Mg chelatase-like AAA ATPase [Bacteroidaceae bacterium]|nr:YifB family Mg chelatase-like AAA ATPase [Paraprevotella sp.]MDY2715551.1 YifB family Mg chelatase-like AAA ATPase [Bacteroidaceae bacterium]MDD6606587.1 YifB family Mg chelatase-like AAA ATPase [Paraprevotella sp.]MDD7241614.1 YifB family Mg chelatase-like AAA ATPase [Paraprevotella sp.]MDY3891241.1 YifB family Mg chelatase-like AAA ATPase [Bacteroidaceae bacterium]
MLVKVYGASMQGLQATAVTIEVNATRGVRFVLVGLPDNAVKESHERILAAIENSGYTFPTRQITINLSPADIRKEGSGYDLPMAIGILATEDKVNTTQLANYMMVGELSLDGSLVPIRGALPVAIKAREMGFEGLFVPEGNIREAAVVNKLKVYGVRHITQVINHLNGTELLEPTIIDTRGEFYARQYEFDYDFADVKGQEHVKRAMEVAAAGGHNMIMIGPPGSGKSMLAKRMPSILPPLSLQESLETTQIHSVAGTLPAGCSLMAQRPYRAPHHTISQVALVGGGTNPQPGEISLAHNGILFCDELPEFQRSVLEVLRQPLEDRIINISRAKYSTTFPCSFMFVASMNPCPCGYYNHPTKACVCTPGQIVRYLNKISGPLLDRIDLQIEITPLSFEEMSRTAPGETSAAIRERVIKARKIQEERFASEPGIHCNAQMNSRLMKQYAQPDEEGMNLLREAMNRLQLSARAYDRILRVSRTIADLAGSDHILSEHISEAIGYRNLDRSNWGE